MSNIAFTLRLEPPPVVFSLYGPDGELLHLTPPAQSDQLVGFVGPGGLDATEIAPLLHTQASASDEWIINHNLGWRPQITVLSAGGIEVGADVRHITTNQARVFFSSPQTGSAIVR